MNDATRIPYPREPLPGPRQEVVCPVTLETELYGNAPALVRAITRTGVFLEVSPADKLPLGTEVTIRFTDGTVSMVGTAVVRSHYVLNYADPQGPNALFGMTLSFLRFEVGERQIDAQFH